MKIADYALNLARLGWRVFPTVNKIPLVDGGVNSATTDETQIKKWFDEFRHAILGIACGYEFFVLDVDRKHGVDGWKSLTQLLGQSIDISTLGPVQRTPNNGNHLLFKIPAFNVPNSVGGLGPGLDLRGRGGYVCSGPSWSRYGWLFEHGPEAEIPGAPEKLLAAIERMGKSNQGNDSNGSGKKSIELPKGSEVERLYAFYIGQALPGNRANACFKLALQLYYADVQKSEAIEIGRRFSRECAQPAGDRFTEREAENAMKSAYNYPKRPRWVFHD